MAEINFLPVCSECGNVLFGEEIDYEHIKDILDGERIILRHAVGIVHPTKCPKCNVVFSKITAPTRLPFYCKNKEWYKNHD